MQIFKPTLQRSEGEVVFSCIVRSSENDKTLWFSVPKQYGDAIEDRYSDPFVLGLLFTALYTGENIVVRGEISEKLYYSYSQILSYILPKTSSDLQPIRIEAEDLHADNAETHSRQVATGFSAGTDSFCTFIDHNVADAPKNYEITHFIFNNVGSHGPRDTLKVFERRKRNALSFAREQNIEFIPINSNLNEFYHGTKFQLTHTIRNVSAVSIFQGFFSKFLYSSSYKIDECYFGETYDMGYIEPYALHLMSTEKLECISAGSKYSRLDKTIKVSHFEPTYRYLDVCMNPTSAKSKLNCSRCRKCCRALLTFEAIDMLSNYDRTFDLEEYRKVRDEYIALTLIPRSGKHKTDLDVLRLIIERGLERPSRLKTLKFRAIAKARRISQRNARVRSALSI